MNKWQFAFVWKHSKIFFFFSFFFRTSDLFESICLVRARSFYTIFAYIHGKFLKKKNNNKYYENEVILHDAHVLFRHVCIDIKCYWYGCYSKIQFFFSVCWLYTCIGFICRRCDHVVFICLFFYFIFFFFYLKYTVGNTYFFSLWFWICMANSCERKAYTFQLTVLKVSQRMANSLPRFALIIILFQYFQFNINIGPYSRSLCERELFNPNEMWQHVLVYENSIWSQNK